MLDPSGEIYGVDTDPGEPAPKSDATIANAISKMSSTAKKAYLAPIIGAGKDLGINMTAGLAEEIALTRRYRQRADQLLEIANRNVKASKLAKALL